MTCVSLNHLPNNLQNTSKQKQKTRRSEFLNQDLTLNFYLSRA